MKAAYSLLFDLSFVAGPLLSSILVFVMGAFLPELFDVIIRLRRIRKRLLGLLFI